jgi:hypothetical protein
MVEVERFGLLGVASDGEVIGRDGSRIEQIAARIRKQRRYVELAQQNRHISKAVVASTLCSLLDG